MPNVNGSALTDPTPVVVALGAAKPGVPPLQLTVWPDWRGAPSEGQAIVSTLALALVAAHQTLATVIHRLAALEIAAVESARLRDAERSDAERVESATRLDLVLADIAQRADGMTLDPPPQGEPSALDLLTVGSSS